MENLWKLLCTLSDKYYSIFKFWLFFTPIILIRHPDDLEVILSNKKYIEKSFIYDTFRPWLGDSIFTTGGAKWHSRRKILNSTFHFNILQQFIGTLIEEGNRMTQSLKDSKGIVVKDLTPFISEHTLNAICETAMGTSLQNLGTFEQQYREAVHQIAELTFYRLKRPWLHNDLIFMLSSKSRLQKRTLQILHGFTEKVIAERKFYHECTNGQHLKSFENDGETEVDNDAKIIGQKKRLALLDLLIAASREGCLTDLDMREEVDAFMFAGHDTTATSISYALLLLAEHKDIQDRIRTEVAAAVQENGNKFTIKLLQNLPYLSRCLKEVLRLYPPAYAISRVTSEDIKLPSYLIPAGTILILNIYAVHRDPNFWPNADVFDPNRFLPEKCQNRHPYSYIPFSAGSRNCIGQRYARMQLKAFIAPLIHNFYLEPIDYLKDLRIKPDLMLRPTHPIRVKFVPI
ncbi:unnamed protein product [Lasius platythorax]